MSGFRKCGIYPLNPGEVTDRQLTPSALFTSDDATPDTPSEDFSALADSSSVVSDRKSNASSLSDILVLPMRKQTKRSKGGESDETAREREEKGKAGRRRKRREKEIEKTTGRAKK